LIDFSPAAARKVWWGDRLTALDASLKEQVLKFLEEAIRELGVPAVYVAHAQNEVARLAVALVRLEGPGLESRNGSSYWVHSGECSL
jgi:ABC-type molybdate transport system ATPase subunit